MTTKAKPFLKWAGGKSQLLNLIEKKIPYKQNDEFSYVEPFVGGGAVLFWILNSFPNVKNVVINDINEDLIEAYRVIKNDIHSLIPILKEYESEYHQLQDKDEDKRQYYNQKRNQFNLRKNDKLTHTALLIFLNKTCFNGLYRVNKKNEFNVPIGSYKKPMICDESNLLSVSQVLQNVIILSGDFEKTIEYSSKKTIFYIDPPYKPLSETSSFNSYSKDSFPDNEQVRLKLFCDKLSNIKAQWILSNSDVKSNEFSDNFFDDLYSDYNITRVNAKRSINSNAEKRGFLTELLITNLEVL